MHRFASCRRLQFRTGQISSQRSFQHSRRFHYQSTKKASNLGLVGLATGVALTVGGLLWYNDERLEAQSDQGTKKTESESLQIMTGIQTNRLVRLLDAQQKNSMIQHMVPIEFEAGQLLCQLGDVPNYFYILESGECEVYNSKNDIIHTLSPGESFGENGFVLFTKRSATIKAKSKVRVWAIDRQTFMKKVLPSSKRLRETFEKYASESKPDGKHMTHDDFVNSLSEIERISGEDTRRLKFLFELADTDKNGSLGFTEFALFDLIASRPDAEFEIAFRVFDTNNNGMISKSDVIKTLRESEEHEGFKFDENCSLMKRFFGDRGERRLRAEEFAQFFVSLTDEIPKQLFQYYDKEQKGYLSQRQFEKLVQDFGYGSWRMPDGIKKRLLEVRSLHKDDKIITFGQFVAFNEFLNHIPALDKVVKDACLKKGSSITQDEFKVACQSVANNISPLEVNVIFTIFDTNRDGRINYSDFKCITQLGRLCSPEELMRLTRPPSSSSSNKIQHEKKTFWDYASETVQHFGLGGIAGGIGATAVYPIDLVKTRMQNQRAISVHERLYKNSIDCFLKVIKNEGPMGLYRGLLPQLMGVSPEKAIKLTVNDLLRSYFRDEAKGKIYLPLEILAGCGAGASQVIFTNPIEIVKIRLQIQGETSKMVQDYKPKSAVTMVRELGIRGLYRGAGACLLRDIPFSGIYFPTYAKMKTVLADEDGKNSNWSLLLAGALAGIPAAALVTPADVVKTRLQVEARKGEATYSGIIDCAKKVYQAEGFKAFWKGALARVLRSSPQFGVTLVSYEMLQRWLSPELEPRPPTNAPVTGEELEAMRRLGSLQQVKRLEKMVKSNEK